MPGFGNGTRPPPITPNSWSGTRRTRRPCPGGAPPTSSSGSGTRPRRTTPAIELFGTNGLAWHNRGLALARLGRWERAAADRARAIELAPRDGWNNDLAWPLATCPEVKVRNPARAVALAQQAVDANPKVGTF
jgi:hypothetical protein